MSENFKAAILGRKWVFHCPYRSPDTPYSLSCGRIISELKQDEYHNEEQFWPYIFVRLRTLYDVLLDMTVTISNITKTVWSMYMLV